MLFGEGVTQFCVVRKPPLRKTCDEDEEGLGRGAQLEKKGDVGPRGTHHFEDRVTFKMEQVPVVASPVVTVSAPCLQKKIQPISHGGASAMMEIEDPEAWSHRVPSEKEMPDSPPKLKKDKSAQKSYSRAHFQDLSSDEEVCFLDKRINCVIQ